MYLTSLRRFDYITCTLLIFKHAALTVLQPPYILATVLAVTCIVRKWQSLMVDSIGLPYKN